jgi:hypothetical protein
MNILFVLMERSKKAFGTRFLRAPHDTKPPQLSQVNLLLIFYSTCGCRVYVNPRMGTISMCTGTPHMRIPSSPCRYAYGVPRIRMAIPICILLHMGVESLISHMRTNTLCIRLVTDISLYA